MLLDTWSWVELFSKSAAGARVRRLMTGRRPHASSLTLAEIAFWCVRNGRDPRKFVDAIRRAAVVLAPDELACESAGRNLAALRAVSPGVGMIDAIIYSQAVANGLRLVTGDPHFETLPEVLFLSR